MRVDQVKDLQICHGSAMDLLRSATVTQGQVCRCPFDCFLIHKHFPCQSVADPVRSGYVLGEICWHGSVTDEKDGLGILSDYKHAATDLYGSQHAVTGLTRTLQMPLRTENMIRKSLNIFQHFQIR